MKFLLLLHFQLLQRLPFIKIKSHRHHLLHHRILQLRCFVPLFFYKIANVHLKNQNSSSFIFFLQDLLFLSYLVVFCPFFVEQTKRPLPKREGNGYTNQLFQNQILIQIQIQYRCHITNELSSILPFSFLTDWLLIHILKIKICSVSFQALCKMPIIRIQNLFTP